MSPDTSDVEQDLEAVDVETDEYLDDDVDDHEPVTEEMTEREHERLERQTDEGAQKLVQESEIVVTGGPWPELEGESQTMVINMGPQHPSTHGVLRIMLELDGETVVRAKPVIGYLHTGMEKTGEQLTYVQGSTNVTRMDYASPIANELVFSMAVERLLDIEVPDARRVGADAARRAEPHGVAPAVPGDERHGPRRRVDDALRMA